VQVKSEVLLLAVIIRLRLQAAAGKMDFRDLPSGGDLLRV